MSDRLIRDGMIAVVLDREAELADGGENHVNLNTDGSWCQRSPFEKITLTEDECARGLAQALRDLDRATRRVKTLRKAAGILWGPQEGPKNSG